MRAILHEPRDRRVARRLDGVGETAEELARHAESRTGAEDVAREIGRAGLCRSAAGDHNAGRELLDQSRLFHLTQDDLEDLLRALVDDVCEQLARDLAIPLRAGARQADLLAMRHDRLVRRAVLLLEPLGVGLRHAQTMHDVGRDIESAVSDRTEVTDLALVEDGDVGGACAHLDQRDAEFLLVIREH